MQVKTIKHVNSNQVNPPSAEVGEEQFESEVLSSGKPVLVAFVAPWSRPCQVLGTVLDELGVECAGAAKVVKVNADDHPSLSLWYEVQSIPTLLYFVNGTLRAKIIGTASKEVILSQLHSVSLGGESTTLSFPVQTKQMNIIASKVFKADMPLIESIGAIRADVGDGLTDPELTHLLLQAGLPGEAGFAFLSVADCFALLSVPQQDEATWHSEKNWISPEKKKAATTFADKYGLFPYEPPDVNSTCLYTMADLQHAHHHLEFNKGRDKMIIAHPCYLKIRLFGPNASFLLQQSQELLQDLAVLYRA